MKKFIPFLLLLFLCACTPKGNPLPEGMEDQAVLDTGREIVEMLNAGEYESVYGLLREDARSQTTAQEVESYMGSVLDRAGEYQRETGAMATGQSLDSGEEYATAVFSCKHRKKTVMYRIAFDRELVLMGFEITAR